MDTLLRHHAKPGTTDARPRFFPADDVLTTVVPVTAALCIGYGDFADFEAEVVIYRDSVGEILICETFMLCHDGKRVKVMPPAGAYAYTPTEFVHQSIIDECKSPKTVRRLEEAMAAAEEACEP